MLETNGSSPSLPKRIAKYMERAEPAVSGQHGHTATLLAARHLVWDWGLSEAEALPYFKVYNERCEPPWKEAELERKLKQALDYPDHRTTRGHLVGEEYSPPEEEPDIGHFQKRETTSPWPAPDLDAIRTITAGAWSLYDLWESSPLRFDDGESHAEDIVDVLFPGDPLLCCGLSAYRFATRRRETWRGHLSKCAFITPNPMLSLQGLTLEGKLSEHCKSATAARIYLVIEFDFSEFARDGKTLSNWAPLVHEWREAGVNVLDATAALHQHLMEYLPLVAAVHSGGKSLHGWYPAFNQAEHQLMPFMRYAAHLGADKQLWTRSQFSRMPGGRRETAMRKSVITSTL